MRDAGIWGCPKGFSLDTIADGKPKGRKVDFHENRQVAHLWWTDTEYQRYCSESINRGVPACVAPDGRHLLGAVDWS